MPPRPAFKLPFRALPSTRHTGGPWICRRCLATQVDAQSPVHSLPPSFTPKKPAHKAENYDPTLSSLQRDYTLTKTDFYLKRKLPQKIPVQYLQHSKSRILPDEERELRANTPGHKKIVGVVVSTGKMEKTVKVRVPRLQWNKRIKKYYQGHTQHLVHDPNNSLIAGDVVSLHRLRVSTAVHHVVGAIITPFEKPIAERPAVPSADDRLAAYKEKRFAKLRRRALRRRAAMGIESAITALRAMGLDPGKGVEVGKGAKANLQKGVGQKRTPSSGAILGAKGQKLPEGVLPDGTLEVGKINERARKNVGRAMKFEAQAEANIAEAKAKGEELEAEGIATETKLPAQGPYRQPPT